MIRYRTIAQRAEANQVIERSNFIGHICPVASREEADVFIASVRAAHKDATHNVPAFVIGEKFELQWASDDGEPSGTSGAPMLQMMVKQGLTNLAVVVTRYFGGIKLGTGGLVRAYTGTAKLAIETAGICAVKEIDRIKVKFDYSFYGKLQNLSAKSGFEILNTEFTDLVTADLAAVPEQINEIKTALFDLTGGTAEIVEIQRELRKEIEGE